MHQPRDGLQRGLVHLLLGLMITLLSGCDDSSAVTQPVVESYTHTQDLLQVSLPAEPGTLDPHQTTYAVENLVLADLYMGLLKRSPQGTVELGAAKTWRVSDDALRWEFELHEDMRWSDGKPIDAYDFLYALRRYVTPATASREAFVLNPIINAEAIIAGEKPPEALGVEVPAENPYRLIIRLNRPAPELANRFIGGTGFPLPKHVIDAHPQKWTSPEHNVSNGAYTLVSWKPQEYLELQRNPYFRKPAAIERFRFISAATLQGEYNRFRSGELHITSTVPMSDVRTAIRLYPSALHTAKTLRSQYLVFNTTQPPFNDLRVRKALTLVLDIQAITDKVLKVGFAPSTSIVPVTVSNYIPAEMPHAHMDQSARKALAKQLLAEAGYTHSNPLRLTLRYIEAGLERKKATIAIMGLWKELGVITQLQQSEMKVHYADLATREYDVAFAAWNGTDTPQSFLYEYSVADPTSNLSGFHDRTFLDIWHRALQEKDQAPRYALFREAEAFVLANYIVAPLFNPLSYQLVSPLIDGWQDQPLSSHAVRNLSWHNP